MIDDIYYSDKDQKENKTEIEFDKKIIDKIEKKYILGNISYQGNNLFNDEDLNYSISINHNSVSPNNFFPNLLYLIH